MPEYLSRRFGGRRLRLYLTVIALGTYLLVTLPVSSLSHLAESKFTLEKNHFGTLNLNNKSKKSLGKKSSFKIWPLLCTLVHAYFLVGLRDMRVIMLLAQ